MSRSAESVCSVRQLDREADRQGTSGDVVSNGSDGLATRAQDKVQTGMNYGGGLKPALPGALFELRSSLKQEELLAKWVMQALRGVGDSS